MKWGLWGIGIGLIWQFFLFVSTGSAFAISPAIIELKSSRGEIIQDHVTVVNSENRSQSFYFSSIAFSSDGETGTPRFASSDEKKEGLPAWIAFPYPSITIPANTKLDVPFIINIPTDIQAGSHTAAIVVSDAPSEVVATNQATIQVKTAALIFLTISGKTIESAALLDFNISSVDSSHLTGTWKARIQNQGNVYILPGGTLNFYDIFGRKLVSTNINSDKGRILPGTTRTFSGTFEIVSKSTFLKTVMNQLKTFAIGPITARFEISYGETSQLLETKTLFWVWPWELIFILVVFLGIDFLVSTYFLKHLRRKQQI
ncbi:MAG: hypothetical protein UU48_C0003G0065 [Candidatus Uhrbacteria bacterium GW2011_GWF2_41_16]|uniref:DUF916 domain-containing protein n=2 Tax=Candidatus Uhriibacteriota TaxID=1752732 RepID=A0A0G0VBT1_9BACT|nr:MAG: hypothetical protein UU31_C0010G0003 [Candidatus Uhrbacteria bacterium GW2011_GWA2_41_10]KKR87438.1 MAG: hypothetical protein UU35_C0003G0065 [Candidatus Uhrbacteria bacterium GW2011_GWC2_41_11]KKR98393.1 MAG: hypothetical protein UU48_C0003G0065 [Candidatus Uhrbacteria bacterium GW2011_GWF2_41_16]HBP00507.1 hypothetical protein [Candidatus Uhrbacteria bacterium]